MAKPRVPEWAGPPKTAIRDNTDLHRGEVFVWATQRWHPMLSSWSSHLMRGDVIVSYADTWCMKVAP